MIKGKPARIGVVLLDASGAPVAGVIPVVEIKDDNAAWKATTNPASESDAKGRSDVLLDAAETNATSIQLYWEPPGSEFVVIHQTAQVLDPADVAAAILADPANKLATGAAGEVTTDTESREASKATGFSTHSAADAGTDAAAKVLATPANKLATGAAGEVTTDTASRDASKADVTGLATQAELDKVAKKGPQRWSHENGEVADVTVGDVVP